MRMTVASPLRLTTLSGLFFRKRLGVTLMHAASKLALGLAVSFILMATTLSASPAYVTGKTTACTATSCTASLTGTNAGDLIVLGLFVGNSTSVSSVTDSQGATFTPIGTAQTWSSHNYVERLYYAKNVAAGSHTITVTLSGSEYMELHTYDYSGLDTSSPLDVYATPATGNGTIGTTNSVAMANANDLVFAFFHSDGGVTNTQGPGFNGRTPTGDAYPLGEDQNFTCAGSHSATMSFSASANYVGFLVAFKAASGGGGSGISCVQAAGTYSAQTISSLAVVFNNNTAAGNTIVVAAATASGSITSVTDTQGNAYAQAVASGGNAIFYTTNIHGGADTVTANFSTSTGFSTSYIHEYSGLATSSSLDQISSQTGSGTAVTSGSKTTTQANELIFGFAAVGHYVQLAGTNFTLSRIDGGNGSEDMIVSSTGGYAATFTQQSGGTLGWTALMATFKAPSGGGGGGGGGGGAAPAFVTGGAKGCASTTSCSVSLTGTNAGDLIVLGLFVSDSTSVSSITDTQGNTYALIGSPQTWSSANFVERLYYAKNIQGGADTVTVTLSRIPSYSLELHVCDYSGLDTSSPLDASATPATGTGTSGTTNSVTATNANDLVFAFFHSDGGVTNTQGPGFNGRTPTGDAYPLGEDQNFTCAGSHSATMSFSASANYVGFLVAFKAASGGGGSGISCVQAAGTYSAQTISSLAVVFNNNTAAGNTIVVAAATASGSITSVTDTQGNAYAQAVASGGNAIFYTTNIHGGADTVTANFSTSTGFSTSYIHEYSGLATSSSLDQISSQTGSGTAVTSGSKTTTQANELIFGFAAVGHYVQLAGTNFTLSRIDGGNGSEDMIVSSTGSYAATFTQQSGGTLGWTALMATFSGASGGGGGGSPSISTVHDWPGDVITSGTIGEWVGIIGGGFGTSQGSSTVSFNGTPATVNGWSANTLYTTVPSGATTGNLVVTVGGVASNGWGFTVLSGPSIVNVDDYSSLTTHSGTIGEYLDINGGGFGASQGSSTVTFNGTPATVSTWSTDTISTTVPSGATTGNLVVTVGGVASNAYSFTVLPGPSIVAVHDHNDLPTHSGTIGQVLAIYGGGFGATQGSSTVTFNGTPATVNTWSADGINTNVPNGATTGNLVVTVAGLASNGYSFTVTGPSPSITSLSPNSGPVGTSVTITGTNFGDSQGTNTVTFSGTAATPTSWSATSIVAPVPSGAMTGNVLVTVSGVASNAETFTVGTTGSTVYYYIEDSLGSSRVITDSSGNLCYDADFYPFGGERAYTTNCSQNYKFTGKERDSESGLDNFGARYNSSVIGRFMSPDPLLNSGRPWEPQSWNRYSYALNNPLNIIDPTGLYDLVNNCDTDDKKCNKQFEQHAKDLRNGLSNLQKQVDKMKDGPEKQRLQAALTAFGTEGDHNGVGATFGTLGGSAAAQTDFHADANGQLSATVTFDPSKISSRDEYAIDAAHEGTHVEDFVTQAVNDYITHGSLPSLSPFSTEYRGYQTSVFAASALGQTSFSRSYDGVNYVLWNGSWAQVDSNVTSFVTKFHDQNGKPDHPETTPHNPWPN